MQIINEPAKMQAVAEDLRLRHQLIAVVMTMGALHEGHLSLLRLARQKAGTVILTIFVNPRQFAPGEDFHRYPRPFEKDAAMARAAGVDYLFAPEPETMYPEGFQTQVSTGGIANHLEGASRPGHFDGMATVVLKLLMLSKPHLAIFGEKDAQQLAVIRRMAADFNIDTKVIEVPTVREDDGLATSSRNIYLSAGEREQATVLYRGMQKAIELAGNGETAVQTLVDAAEEVIRTAQDAAIDYVSVVDAETFTETERLERNREYRILVAVRIGSTRLIDNCRFRAGRAEN